MSDENKIEKQKTPEEDLQQVIFYLKWGMEYWEKAFDLVMKLPKEIKDDVETSANYGYKHLAQTVASSLEDIKKFEEAVIAEKIKVYNILDSLWVDISKKYDELEKKVEKLKSRKLDIDTYSAERILELLNKLAGVSEDNWKKFEKICNKLGEN